MITARFHDYAFTGRHKNAVFQVHHARHVTVHLCGVDFNAGEVCFDGDKPVGGITCVCNGHKATRRLGGLGSFKGHRMINDKITYLEFMGHCCGGKSAKGCNGSKRRQFHVSTPFSNPTRAAGI